jgi:hypothetical protein
MLQNPIGMLAARSLRCFSLPKPFSPQMSSEIKAQSIELANYHQLRSQATDLLPGLKADIASTKILQQEKLLRLLEQLSLGTDPGTGHPPVLPASIRKETFNIE